jgi:predicted transcriptional regulator
MLLLSIRPEFVEKIFAGEKRVELRRRRPRLQTGDTIAIYATAPRCELVGLARVVGIRRSTPRGLWLSVRNDAGIDRHQYDRYFEGSENAIGIELEDPVEFNRPATLKELRFAWPGFHPPQGYRYLTTNETELIDQLRERPTTANET